MNNLKKKFGRRILAYLLSGAMILSSLTTSNMTAFASEASSDTGGKYSYEETSEADDANADDAEEKAEADEVLRDGDNTSDEKEDVKESSDEAVEETKEKDSEQTSEVKSSDEEQASEIESSNEEQTSETESSLRKQDKETKVTEFDNTDGELRTFWDFKNDGELTETTIQNNTGSYFGLEVDATQGKFYRRNSGGNTDLSLNSGTVVKIPVSGKSKITVVAYSAQYAQYKVDGTAASTEKDTSIFECEGTNGYAELEATNTAYLFSIKVEVENSGEEIENPDLESGNGKIDVWDFGAEALDTEKYNNKLTADIINGWYPSSVAPGTSGTSIGGFEVKDSDGNTELKFDAAGATSHRLRTTNTSLTRYDNKDITYNGVTYSGYVYSNSDKNKNVCFQLAVQEGDIVTLVVSSNGGNSTIEFMAPSGEIESDVYNAADKAGIMTFYAAETGLYKFYSVDEKLVVARIYRERPTIVKVSGSVTAPADIPSGYALTFENQTTGVIRKAAVANDAYEVELQEGYKYTVGLLGADEYVAETGNVIDLTQKTGNDRTGKDISIVAVNLLEIEGKFIGLDTGVLENLDITLENKDKVYQPELTISNGGYSAKFETGVTYNVKVSDKEKKYAADDYILKTETIMADAAATDKNITFEKKPVYKVTIVPEGDAKSLDDIKGAVFKFSYIDTEKEGVDKTNGYTYTFDDPDQIELRDGTYSIEVTNSGTYVQ